MRTTAKVNHQADDLVQLEIIDLAERRLAKLELENRRLANEVGRLREKLPPTRHEAIIIQALQDAKTILHLRHAQFDVSRRILSATGLVSEFHYGWALGLLKAAKVQRADVSTLAALADAISRVEMKAKEMMPDAQGEAGKLWRLRSWAGKRYIAGRYEKR